MAQSTPNPDSESTPAAAFGGRRTTPSGLEVA
jgi:hypothetical protein